MIKIALIEPIGGHGGMDFYDYGLAQGLGKNNIEVHYFTSSQTNCRNYKNVTTHLFFRNVWNASNKVVRLYYFLDGYLRSFKAADNLGIKIIHLQFFDLGWLNFLLIHLASLFKFKKVLTLHDVSSFKSKDRSSIEKFILKQFSQIIVHNKVSYQELSEKINSIQKVKIIPHGNYLPFVDELAYSPKADEKLKLLFFGQIKKVKGLDVLLKAVSIAKEKNKNIHLTIAGKPWHDSKEIYLELIRSLGLNDFVTANFKFIPNETVADYFEEADVVVLPYKKIYQSGVLLLSMSYGRVTLASDLPAFKEIVEDGKTGFLFREGNPNDLAHVILKISKKKGTLNDIRENTSQMLHSKFDWAKIGAQTQLIYKKL